MLGIHVFRENADLIRRDHDKRGLAHDKIDEVIHYDNLWLSLQHETNKLRQQKNTAAKGISEAKKSGDETAFKEILSQVATLGEEISKLEQQTDDALANRDNIRMTIPNLLHSEVPEGGDESGNTTHSKYGNKPSFEFVPRTHNELIEMNKWVDLKRAAKIAGSRFFFLKGDLARLEMALQNYSVDFLTQKGFTFVQPPVMMNRQA